MLASLCVICKIKNQVGLQPMRQKRATIRKQDNIPVIFNGLKTGDKHSTLPIGISVKQAVNNASVPFSSKQKSTKHAKSLGFLKILMSNNNKKILIRFLTLAVYILFLGHIPHLCFSDWGLYSSFLPVNKDCYHSLASQNSGCKEKVAARIRLLTKLWEI